MYTLSTNMCHTQPNNGIKINQGQSRLLSYTINILNTHKKPKHFNTDFTLEKKAYNHFLQYLRMGNEDSKNTST